MMRGAKWSRLWRPALLAMSAVFAVGLFGAGVQFAPAPAAEGMMQVRDRPATRQGTPVPAAVEPDDPQVGDPLDGDPLDGEPVVEDPLDGDPPSEDSGAPEDQTQLDIVRSGRPNDEPRSLPAYDDDLTSVWVPEASEEPWVWFDLGDEQRVRVVRWLAEGAGAVEVAVSIDRSRWQEVERVEVDDGWQGVTLRDDARYVRLQLQAEDDDDPPALTEVAVYGRDRGGSVSAEQQADEDERQRRRDRANRDDRESRSDSRRNAEADDASTEDSGGRRDERRSGGRVRISAEPGETRCRGDRERCEARQGAVSVEEDCAEDGSCTIDIQADGGTAICDATGGDEARAGDGEGRRGGEGGRCEAVANGGAVAIGDINP